MDRPGSLEPELPLPGAEPVAEVHAAKMEAPPVDEGAKFASSKLFRCACVKRLLPLAYRVELYHVLRLTGPLLLSRILNFLLPFVITIFCGHIGNAELAGYALASATINVTTTATGYGLTMACDTLISQTYGSRNMKRVGVILQKSTLILLLFCLPCWALLINSHNLLLLLHQEHEVARIANLYVMTFLPAVPAMFLHQLQVSYLQNQGIILPQMYTAAVANIFNLGINYLLISVLKLGVIGSAVANSLSQIIICLLLFGYIRWKKLHQRTWGGWSTECLQGWGSFMKLAVPSAFMICFEWWVWEVGGFLAADPTHHQVVIVDSFAPLFIRVSKTCSEGVTVVSQVGVEVLRKNDRDPKRGTDQADNSQRPIPDLKRQECDPLIYRGKSQHETTELGVTSKPTPGRYVSPWATPE
ncbi:hypothetical protein ILYODFUR_019298 [Ilyodon furcidens]|uniref:Multidrug and toxin extrusion protein n=1 Tax=Ilyodon furcidens TaxID=33524 RepID=A0ABV0V4B5_9TELE